VVGESRSDLLPLAFVVAMRSAGNAETRARIRWTGVTASRSHSSSGLR